MSEIDENDELFDERDTDNDDIRRLRSRARAASKFERENSALAEQNRQLTRQIAFASAGLALKPQQEVALLAAHGDQPLTADALKATAVELGFAQPEPDPQAAVQAQAVQQQQTIAQAQAGAQTPDPLPNIEQQIAAAQQEGDLQKVMRLKSAVYLAQMAKQGHATVT